MHLTSITSSGERAWRLGVFFAGILLVASSARAATLVWAASGTDFNAGSSWVGGVAPGSSDIATFSGTGNAATQPNVTANATISGIGFTTSTANFTLSGSAGVALTLTSTSLGTGKAIDATGASTNVIAVPLILGGGTQAFKGHSNANVSALQLNGSISSAADVDLTLDGRLALNAANSYTGITRFTTGAFSSIYVGDKAAFGTSTLVVNGSGGFTPMVNLTGANRLTNPIRFEGTGGTFTVGGGPLVELGGNITVGANAHFTSNAFEGTTISGVISGTGNVDFSNINIANTNTFTGNATISAGNTRVTQAIGNAGTAGPLGAGSAITISGGGSLIYTGPGETINRALSASSSTSTQTIESSGTGPLVFTANVSYGSGTLVLGGTNSGDNALQGVISGSTNVLTGGGITKTGSGNWILTGANTYTGTTTVELGALKLAGAGTLGIGPLVVNAGVLDLNAYSHNTASSFTMAGGLIISSAGTAMITASSFNLTSTGTINVPLAGPGSLTKTGTGVATLNAINTYSGTTTVNDGGLVLGVGASLRAGMNLVVNAYTFLRSASFDFNGNSASIGSLTFGGPTAPFDNHVVGVGVSSINVRTGTVTLGGDVTVLAGGNGGAGVVGDGGKIDLGGPRNFNIADPIVGIDLTVSAIVSGAGATLTKLGAGDLVLSNNNTYSGGTFVNAGMLEARNSHALGTGPASVASGGTLALINGITLINSIDLSGRLAGPGGTSGAVTLNSGGVIAPSGGSVANPVSGTATMSVGSLTWNGGGKFAFKLGSGTTSDRLSLTGSLIKGTSGTYVFDFMGTGIFPSTYTLVTFSALNGFTAGDASPFSYINAAPGVAGYFSLTPTTLTFTTTGGPAIPEPGTSAAILAGCALVGAVWRRRKQAGH